MKTLVLGVGNPILGDDAFGWEVVTYLRQALPPGAYPGLELDCVAVGGLELVERIGNVDHVILVDAIQGADSEIGKIRRLTSVDFQDRPVNQSHGLTFPEALSLAHQLRMPVPKTIIVYTVDIPDQLEFRDTLSPAVADSLAAVVRSVIEEVQTITAG